MLVFLINKYFSAAATKARKQGKIRVSIRKGCGGLNSQGAKKDGFC